MSIEPKWCLDCLWNKADVDKGQVPNTAKLIRLSFHDCKPYITEDGQRSGGRIEFFEEKAIFDCLKDVMDASIGLE